MRDVVFTIEVLIETYYQDAGKKPAGLVLGPAEYRDLCNRAKRAPDFLKQAAVGEVLITEYKGFPLYVKELPGVDILIPFQEAFSHAYR